MSDPAALAADLERRGRGAVRRGDSGGVRAALRAADGAGPDVGLAVVLRVGEEALAGRHRGVRAAVADVNGRALDAEPLEPERWALQEQLTGVPAPELAGPDPAGQTLSLAMIVRDEERMLEDCLASVRGVADELVVVDTGSVDRTVDIARAAGARVVEFPWTGSFADARNVSLEHATGDWILLLDADERLEPGSGAVLRGLLGRVWRRGFHVRLRNLTGEAGMSADVVGSYLRVWRNGPGVRFTGAIHEQLTGLPDYVPERLEHTSVSIVHHGYRADVVAAAGKRDRNLAALEQQLAAAGDAPDAFLLFNLGTEHLLRGEHAEAVRRLSSALAAAPDVRASAFGPRLAVRLVRALRGAGDAAGAEERAAALLRVLPDHTDLAVERALAAADGGDAERGLTLLADALAMGDGPAAYGSAAGMDGPLGALLRGELLSRAGRHAEATEAYRSGLRADPSHLAGLGKLAEALLATGTPADAVVAELEPLAARHPAAAGTLLGEALVRAGALDAAEGVLRRVLGAGADVVPGDGGRATGPPSGASAASPPGPPSAASAASPDLAKARVLLADVLLRRGDTRGAAALCDPLPDDPSIAVALARCAAFCRLVDGDPHGASPALAAPGVPDAEREAYAAWGAVLAARSSEALSPDAVQAALEALGTAIRLGRGAACDVLHALVAGSRLAPGEARSRLGRVFFDAGYQDIAVGEWTAAVEQAGPTAPALVGLAQVALGRGMADDAHALAAEALELDPGDPVARLIVQRLARR